MTDQAIRVVPAGWYEDPASSAHVRWWNGLAWTEHTTLKPTPIPRPQPMTAAYGDYGDGFGDRRYGDRFTQQQADAQAASPARPASAEPSPSTGSTHSPETLARIAEARELERQYGISTEEHDIIVRAASEGMAGSGAHSSVPVVDGYRPWNAEPEDEDHAPGTATASAWFIALWAVLTLAAAATAVYLAYYVAPEPAIFGIPLVAAVALVPSLLTVLWAVTDARKLRSLGHRPASPGLALLGPLVYLIARRTRVPGAGPLVTLIVLTLLAAAPVAAFATGSAVTLAKALEIQQAVRAEYVDSGQLLSVSCPPFIDDLSIGSIYRCDGVLPDGTAKTVIVSIDSVDGTFSTALSLR